MAYAIGIDIGATFTKSAVVDTESGNILNFLTSHTHLKNPCKVEDDIVEHVKVQTIFARKVGINSKLPVGIGIPGIVDKTKSIVLFAINIGWENYPIIDSLKHRIANDIFIESDRNVGILAEKIFGQLKDVDNGFFISWGSGMGASLFIEGKLYRGSHGSVAEFGHTKINKDNSNTICSCGNKGCLNTFSGTRFLIPKLNQLGERSSPINYYSNLIKMMNEIDKVKTPKIYSFFLNTLDAVAFSISNLIAIVDPEVVVIGGGMSVMNDSYLSILSDKIIQYTYPPLCNGVIVKKSSLGRFGGVIGAAIITL